jgi:hypothetical protein
MEIFAAQGAPPVSLTQVENGKNSIIKVLIILLGHHWEAELTYRYIFASGLSSLILFPLFDAGVIDTGGKLPDTGSKFAAGFVDTGVKFATSINNTSETGSKICRW